MLRIILIALLSLVASSAWAEGLNQTRPEAPEFSLRTLKGDTMSLAQTKGKVVIMSFWASWCKPCIQELGFLKALQAKHPERLLVLAISTDDPNTMSKVRTIVKRKKLTMPILLDQEGTVMGLLNPRGELPFSLYLDTAGRIASDHRGFKAGDESKIEQIVNTLLAESSSAPTNQAPQVPTKSDAPAKK